jgi:DNA-binding NarL/FixJ family response regulator
MIASALRNVGLTVAELHNARPPAAIVFDADPWDGNRAAELAHLRSTHPRSQLVACAGFSRPHVTAELRDAGADAVWFKVAPLADLIDCAAATGRCGSI